MTYPTEITPKVLAQMAHITDAEIQQDILVTQKDIGDWTRKEIGYRLLGGKVNLYYANAYAGRIGEAQRFVEFLSKLKLARQKTDDNT